MSLLSCTFSTAHRLLARSRPLAAVLGLGLMVGCPKGDVGAPCNHGTVEPPQSQVTTFPAVTCNDLICIFPENPNVPTIDCDNDSQCNMQEGGGNRYQCNIDRGRCEVAADYVLEKSMCSKKCNSDADCKDGGPGKRVVDPDTACGSDFKCVRIQALGQFCCQRLCVCNDDLAPSNELDAACDSGTQVGCCRDETDNPITPTPEGCGR